MATTDGVAGLWARAARGGVAELRELVDRHAETPDQRSALLRAAAGAMERNAARGGGSPELVATAAATRRLADTGLPTVDDTLPRTTITGLAGTAKDASTMTVSWAYSPSQTGIAGLLLTVTGTGVAVTQQVQPSGGTWPTSVDVPASFQPGATYLVSALVTDAFGPLPAPIEVSVPFLPTSPSLAAPQLVPADCKGIFRGIQAAWNVPATNVPDAYLVTVAGAGLEVVRRVTPGAAGTKQLWTLDGLLTGVVYTVTVQAEKDGLLSLPAVTAIAAGLPGSPLVERVAALSGDPLASAAPDLAALRGEAAAQLDRVDAIARKLTYQALRDRAAASARTALDLDRLIVELQQQVLDKATAAQGLFNVDVLAVLTEIGDVVEDVGGIPTDVDIAEAIDGLAETVRDAAVTAAVLAWLATHSALELWKGLLEALFKDVASGSRSFSHTSDFIDSQYDTLQAAIVPFVEEQRAQAQADIEQLVAPLRAASAGLVGATQTKMAEVFTAFDVPLTLGTTPQGDAPLPNVDPTASGLDTLTNVVDEMVEQLHAQVAAALDEVLDAASEIGREIVRAIVIAYIVAPIAAALVVALLGGGIGAVVIAFALVVAAEELVHLIAGWIAGTLQDQLDAALARVADARRTLARALRAATGAMPLVAETGKVVWTLELLATELQQLADLLPMAALEEAIGTLGDARDAVLAGATLTAQAAERAAGRAHATAFDAIERTYAAVPGLRTAQMPGLDDANLFAGARLLADLERLEDAVAGVLDESALEVELPVSLSTALGAVPAIGDAQGWSEFRRTGRALVDVADSATFDELLPGMYRALLADVTATPAGDPLVAAPLPPLPVTVTHLGESATRTNVASNPLTPSAFPPLLEQPIFSTAATYLGPTTLTGINDAASNSLVAQVFNSLQGGFTGGMAWSDLKALCLDVLPGQLARVAGGLADVPIESATATSNATSAGAAIDAATADVWAPASTDAAPAITLTLQHGIDELVGVRVGFASAVTSSTAVTVQVSPDGQTFAPAPAPELVVQPGTGGAGWAYVHFGASEAAALRVAVPVGSQVVEVRPLSSGRTAIDVAIAGASVLPSYWDPNDSAASLVTSPTRQGVFATEQIDTPDPGRQPPALALSLATSGAVVERIRLLPHVVGSGASAQASGVPTSVQCAFVPPGPSGTLNWTLTARAAPIDLTIPPTRAQTVTLTAYTLGQVFPVGQSGVRYAFEAADVEISGFAGPEPPREVVQAFRTALTPLLAALDTTGVPTTNLLAVSLFLAQALDQASLGDVGWQVLRDEQVFRAAKWGGAELVEDPDPAARGSGYVLLRRSDPRTQVVAAAVPSTTAPGALHPLAGRGVYGRYLLEVPPHALAEVTDLTLSLRCAACFSPELADAVRTGLADRDRLLAVAGQAVSATAGSALLVPRTAADGLGATRTLTVSLRAHRDRTAQAVAAAAGALGGTGPATIAGISIPDRTQPPAPLPSAAPLSFVGTQALSGTSLGVTFSETPPADLAQGLVSAPLSLDSLGIPADLAGELGSGALLAVSWAFVPSARAFYGTLPAIAPTASGTTKLAPYIATPSPAPILRFGEQPPAASLMTLAELFSGTALALAFSDGGGQPLDAVAAGLVYDVVLGLTVALPG
jgi:hypothetical protein